MRTLVMFTAVGIAVALVGVLFAGPTAADRVVGPVSGTLLLAGAAVGTDQAPHVLLVKGGGKQGGKQWGHHKWGHYPYDRWYGYPDYGWDSDYSDSDYQNCVWNGYSYTCFKRSDRY